MAKKTKEEKAEEVKSSPKELKSTIENINKDFGPGSIMRLGDKPTQTYDIVSTGSFGLDIALGVGGVPRGRVIEIFGKEGSGKTTIGLQILGNCQKKGGKVAMIDAEYALDTLYASNLGVNIKDLYLNQPSNTEEGLEILSRLIESGEFSAILIDSVAALVPKKELEGEAGDSAMGLQARLMSQALRKITGSVSKTNTLVIFINQIREKIGIMFGNPETTTGGRALAFYASIRLDVSRIGQIKDGDEIIANKTKVRVIKNKVAPPFKSAEFSIIFGKGIDKVTEVIEAGIALEIINQNGSWYSYNTDKLAQGISSVKELLEDNQELYAEIYEKVVSKINS